VVHRGCTLEAATWLKLGSVFSYDIAVDAFAVDNLDSEYRFTITYILQSSLYNTSVRLETKTKDGLVLSSIQGLYPAFN
jgi:NADH:ubiquinone oxidoreductase subunit C